MAEDEGLELLLCRSKLERNDINIMEGRKVVQMLGYLPLAIDQAGAYISTRRLPLQLFAKHYAERKEVVLKHTPSLWEYRRRLIENGDEISLNVFTTWELTFQQIGKNEDEQMMIGHFLTLSAFFDTTNIGGYLFRSHLAANGQPPQWKGLFTTDDVWDKYKFQDVLVGLQSISLLQSVDIGGEETRFSMHPLVSDWLKLRPDQKSRQDYTIEATAVLRDYINSQDPNAFPLSIKLEI